MNKTRFRATTDVHLLLVNGEGRVLLGKRQNTGFADGKYHLPAGHVEQGETVTETLLREAKEECGISIDPNDIRFGHIMHRRYENSDTRTGFFFEVGNWQGDVVNCEPEKCSGWEWFPLGELPEEMVAYARAALAAYQKGQAFSVYEGSSEQ